MPAMELRATVDTLYTVDQARQRARDFFASVNAKVSNDEEGRVVATRGSRVLIRILGAYLMPMSWIPTKATLGFAEAERGCTVDITVADNYGVGIRTGVKGRFGRLLEAQMAEIESQFG
jgi:hypothetical protein